MQYNPLNYVGEKARLGVYLVIATLGLVVGAFQIGYASLNAGQPDWLTVALAVLPFLASGLGFTAATHVSRVEGNAVVTEVPVVPETTSVERASEH